MQQIHQVFVVIIRFLSVILYSFVFLKSNGLKNGGFDVITSVVTIGTLLLCTSGLIKSRSQNLVLSLYTVFLFLCQVCVTKNTGGHWRLIRGYFSTLKTEAKSREIYTRDHFSTWFFLISNHCNNLHPLKNDLDEN